jgi:hypothetical protein
MYESNNNDLIIVDIQPEYTDAIYFNLIEFGEFVNNYNGNITFLYNGADTLGMIEESDLKYWLNETCLITEETLDNIEFYDKGYGFLRELIDNGYNEDDIVVLLNWMKQNDIYTSQQEEFKKIYNDDVYYDIEDMIEYIIKYDAHINIPEVYYDVLVDKNNVNIVGGGEYECLLEVIILLKLAKVKYTKIDKFIY